jgi:outer membrane receptor for ferrienterochelin and colicin
MLGIFALAAVLGGDVVGTVTDSASGAPLPSVEVTVQQGTAVVANTSTDPFGRYIIHNIAAGSYTVAAHFIGFLPQSRPLTIASGTAHADFKLIAAPPQLEAVTVTSRSPIAVDTRSGDQTYTQDESHSAPTTTTSGILQQSIAGAARAPTGEVHIRGQHAEYQYYIDGVPVPSGVSGSLNELFDPAVVQSIDFQTGAWDAEYGGKNVAVINIQTRVPAGGFHGEEATYGGSYGALGQSLSMSGNDGPIGAFFSGTAQGSNMRLEPVEAAGNDAPVNFHNAGQDYFGFGKLQYTGGSHDIFSLDGNYSKTHFDIPYDSAGGAFLNDHQTDVNAFLNLSYRHNFGDSSAQLFVGPFYRHGSLNYVPGANDNPTFVDAEDPTHTPRTVSEDRSFNTVGVKTDLSVPIISDVIEGKVGTLYSHTSGNENFELTDPTGAHGPIQSISNLDGYDWGSYAQVSIKPFEWIELRTGVRFDSHVAPFAGNQTQWSPRVRLNFFPSPSNTIYLYFGRQFIPTNIEDLRSITAVGDSGVVTTPTLPERDAFYEGGYVHRFPYGFVNKTAVYHKVSTPGIDDNTVPGSSITTDVNIAEVQVVGLEDALEWQQPQGPFSGYVNFAINHAYGRGPVSGGFFPIATPTYTFDLDHDQRVSVVANLTYSAHAFYVTASSIYGTGLTNGLTPDGSVPNDTGSVSKGTFQPGYKNYGTCLFCFNSEFKVHPSYIQNLSLGYTLFAQRTYIRPELFFTNLFDAHYILKGAFFSGESIGRPFTVNFRLTLGV